MCGSERTVVGEDLDVVEPVPARSVERAEDAGHVGLALPREHAVGPAAGRLADVGHMDAHETVDLLLDVLIERLGVP